MDNETKKKKIAEIKRKKRETLGAMEGVKSLQRMGFLEDIEVSSDEEAFAIIHKMEQDQQEEYESIGNEIGDLAPLVEYKHHVDDEGGPRKYSIDAKSTAIYLMEIINREDENGELIPMYSVVSNLMGIPDKTLRNWYDKKESIIAISEGVTAKLGEMVKRKLEIEILRMVTSLSRRDYDKMNAKDFFTGMKTVLMQYRILDGKSTQNVAHDHQHHGSVQVVPTDDMAEGK